MYPFWNQVIEPLVRASGAERLVEIGALRGENTRLMLDALGPSAELHVIDPVPAFDPDEHARDFPGRYVFHRDLSLNVLPTAPPFDVALVDGDHNWFTVYHELGWLARTARDHNRHLPLLMLHDVGWPYGRRDLYYAPEQIPEEFRQPHRKKGMRPGRSELLPGGGMNITLDNAESEGGQRNGVMTALDDFMTEHDRPLRLVVLPIYFGLAIVAEEAMLADNPAVAELLDRLESVDGTRALLELSEEIRLEGVVFEHNIERIRNDRASRSSARYLRLLESHLAASVSTDVLREACIQTSDVGGAVVSVGLGDGTDAAFLAGVLSAERDDPAELWAIDGDGGARDATKHILDELDLAGEDVHIVPPSGATRVTDSGSIALLHVGADLGPTLQALAEQLEGRVVDGGIVVRDGELHAR